MADKLVTVHVFAAPDASCGGRSTWSGATSYIRARLRQRFGDRVVVEHIELFSARSFEFPNVLAAIQGGAPLPIVEVDGRIVSEGTKLSERAIGRAAASVLEGGDSEEDRHDDRKSARGRGEV